MYILKRVYVKLPYNEWIICLLNNNSLIMKKFRDRFGLSPLELLANEVAKHRDPQTLLDIVSDSWLVSRAWWWYRNTEDITYSSQRMCKNQVGSHLEVLPLLGRSHLARRFCAYYKRKKAIINQSYPAVQSKSLKDDRPGKTYPLVQ